jgi:hypothetical protein
MFPGTHLPVITYKYSKNTVSDLHRIDVRRYFWDNYRSYESMCSSKLSLEIACLEGGLSMKC